jgi:hypothetical protein
MAERPEWDTSVPGINPKLTAPVTDEEIEASRKERARLQAAEQYIELADSRLRGPDTLFLNQAIKNETAHSENLKMLGDVSLSIPNRQERIATHLRGLCEALWQQGRIAEALEVAVDNEQHAFVLKVQEAIEKPDDADCGCEREVVDGLTLCRRFDTGYKVLSGLHGKVVSIWECSQCHDWNGLPEPPARQAAIEARAQALRAQGVKPVDRDLLKS